MIRIGFSACFFHPDPKRPIFKGKTLLFLEEQMIEFFMSYKVFPVLIPRTRSESDLDFILSQIDGMVFQGGSDISPLSYQERPLKKEWEGDPIRDEYEIALLRRAMDLDKPVWGICRGMQLINVALGGSLYQDIPTQYPSPIVHRNYELYDMHSHEITLDAEGDLARMYDKIAQRKVLSIHHQAVKDVAEGLVVEAYAKQDSLIEALRYKGRGKNKLYVFGVQWHPEFQDLQDHSLMSPLPMLEDFLAAVRLRKKS